MCAGILPSQWKKMEPVIDKSKEPCYNPPKFRKETIMLRIVRSMKDLNFSELMEVYSEGNLENARELYPHLPEGQGILRAEQDFHQYLREIFFQTAGAYYAIWQQEGRYISALRLEPYRDGLLLNGLETPPEYRRQGYARKLVQAALELCVGSKVYSHVHKKNTPSLQLHLQCGFRRISEQAIYLDGSVNSRCCTLLYQK